MGNGRGPGLPTRTAFGGTFGTLPREITFGGTGPRLLQALGGTKAKAVDGGAEVLAATRAFGGTQAEADELDAWRHAPPNHGSQGVCTSVSI